MIKNIKKVMKKLPKKIIAITMVLAMTLAYFVPLTKVLANNSYGEGEHSINLDIQNDEGFTIGEVTINSHPWTSPADEYHSNNNQYHITINVSGNETTGDKVPRVGWGGNWNGDDGTITSSVHRTDSSYEFALDLTVSSSQSFVGLFIEEDMGGPAPGGVESGPEPGEGYFDGRAYVVWSCGNGVCYHYFENIPNFDDGNSTFYKDTDITADNKAGVTFDVKAQYKGWYLADEFIEWAGLYKVAGGDTVNWETISSEILSDINWDAMNPADILGEPNQHINELIDAAVNSKMCTRPAEDAPGEEKDEFEHCIHLYAAEHDHNIWTHKLQPVGEPTYNNCYVSYGDRNFKVVIYNNKYKGVTMGDLSKLSYYPSEWTNPFIRRDQFDLSGTTKNKPALLNSILLESTVRIKTLDYNGFEIASIEPLDVPADAVTISKENGEFKLEYSSNFYDNVTFKVTDTKGEVTYMLVQRYTIDGWIKFADNHPVLTADFYFDRERSYADFELTAKIIYKDGTTKNVKLEAAFGIDDGLGNITNAYEVDEENTQYGPKGKGLKKASFEYALEDGEDREIEDVYLNAEYKGSTESTYAGAYVGSGEGIRANIYHGEEE